MQERRATEHNHMLCAARRLRVRSFGRALNCVDACVQQVRIKKKGQPFKMAHLLSQKDIGKQSVRPVFFSFTIGHLCYCYVRIICKTQSTDLRCWSSIFDLFLQTIIFVKTLIRKENASTIDLEVQLTTFARSKFETSPCRTPSTALSYYHQIRSVSVSV